MNEVLTSPFQWSIVDKYSYLLYYVGQDQLRKLPLFGGKYGERNGKSYLHRGSSLAEEELPLL